MQGSLPCAQDEAHSVAATLTSAFNTHSRGKGGEGEGRRERERARASVRPAEASPGGEVVTGIEVRVLVGEEANKENVLTGLKKAISPSHISNFHPIKLPKKSRISMHIPSLSRSVSVSLSFSLFLHPHV